MRQATDDSTDLFPKERTTIMIEGNIICEGCRNLIQCLAYGEQIVVIICGRCRQTTQISDANRFEASRLELVKNYEKSEKTTHQAMADLAKNACPRATRIAFQVLISCPTCKKQDFFTKQAPKRRRALRWYAEKKPCKRDKRMPLPLP
jgi:hypothetical protein